MFDVTTSLQAAVVVFSPLAVLLLIHHLLVYLRSQWASRDARKAALAVERAARAEERQTAAALRRERDVAAIAVRAAEDVANAQERGAQAEKQRRIELEKAALAQQTLNEAEAVAEQRTAERRAQPLPSFSFRVVKQMGIGANDHACFLYQLQSDDYVDETIDTYDSDARARLVRRFAEWHNRRVV